MEGQDRLNGDNGNDTINGGEGDDRIAGNNGNDLLNGDGGNDTISGDRGDDELFGGSGHDSLVGGRGDDLIVGEEGTDLLSGGRGHDTFVLETGDQGDTITDFTDGSDRLKLSEGLTFDNLIITNNESNAGVFILDAANDDSLIASIENVLAADLTSHDFTNV